MHTYSVAGADWSQGGGGGEELSLLADNVMGSSVYLHLSSFKGMLLSPPEVRWDNMISSGDGNVVGSDVYYLTLRHRKAPVWFSRLSLSRGTWNPKTKVAWVTESPHEGHPPRIVSWPSGGSEGVRSKIYALITELLGLLVSTAETYTILITISLYKDWCVDYYVELDTLNYWI